MNGYDIVMSPIEKWVLKNVRAEIMDCAEGNVLEVGIGTGANLGYYDFSKLSSLTGLDTEYSPEVACCRWEHFRFFSGSVESLSFEDSHFDCVVATLILCSVDLEKSIQEIKRVLKPGGTFIFIEHVRPSGKVAGKFFDILNGVWPKMAHGCNLNRRTDRVLNQSGFSDLDIRQACGGIFCYGTAKN